MRVLVAGGAGYIGSHMVRMLMREGHEVVVLDDLSGGHRNAVPEWALVQGDIGNARLVEALLQQHGIEAVMHFASFIQVGESVAHPARYYDNNLGRTLALLGAMARCGVRRFVFSSTAAVFGDPEYSPMDEAHPRQPVNPYGRTKLMVEQALPDFEAAYGLRAICLRYFNAAGADPEGGLGERHEPETHLIPLALQAAMGMRPPLQVFGSDYPTRDGTCVRDYIHVNDLCAAHLLVLERLADGAPGAAYNLGNGRGFTVREVIDAIGRVTGLEVPRADAPRRAGDPPELVADGSLARRELGWVPRYPDLETMVEHAWRWELERRRGEGAAPREAA